ncbi:hypothetical protein [Candidatus Ichthyocystis sparus]|uniref:hypothetical protein n=1 Tax=Candidatus Ichthyocystis sparus TaxID=1561004 RepID=UPI000B89D895|nr:hypothetical protein [Candidatus Ichthyocystis sparus]
MSDKRICGTSVGDNSSESDETGVSGREYLLGAISQDTKGGKSEKKGAGSSRGGASAGALLTNPSGSGSFQELHAKPKTGYSRENKKLDKKNDIWHNPTRKRARTLKGQGQKLAATDKGKDGTESGEEDLSGLVAVRAHEGPRDAYYGRGGRTRSRIISRGRLSYRDLCSVLIFSTAIVIPIAAGLLPLFLSITKKLSNSDQASAPADELTARYYCYSFGVLVYTSILVGFVAIVTCVYLSNNNKNKRKK